jgi:predicted DNA-binding ribbon-helix-helix protein
MFTRIKATEQQQHSIEVKRTNQVSISTALTSRNAENLFWVRLSERTMALTSVLKNNFNRLNENVSSNGKNNLNFSRFT